MEQKRILWIVAAVGLFLLVVIGAAMLISNPVQNTTKLTALEGNGSLWINTDGRTATVYSSADPLVSTADSTDAATPPATGSEEQTVQNLTVHAENTIVYTAGATTEPGVQTIDIIGSKTDAASSSAVAAGEKTPAAQPATPAVTPAVTAATTTPAKTAAPAKTTTPAASTRTTTAPASSAASSTSTSTAAAKTTTVKTVAKKAEDSYFVQVGSFTSKKNAEDARSLLTDEKIPAEIFTWKNDKGTVFYRLRVGPYKTKTEANYWLTRIKLIDGFATEAAYVVNSPATEE